MKDMLIPPVDRAAIYEIFASLYLNTINKNNIDNILEALEQSKERLKDTNDDLIESFQNLIDEIKKKDENSQELEQEYYDHFLVPQRGNYIPVYESFIKEAKEVEDVLKKGRYRWEYNTSQDLVKYNLKLAYDSVGFMPLGLNAISQLRQESKIDFIGFQLAFMSYLTKSQGISDLKEQIENSKRWFNLQSQYLEEHLRAFVERYNNISNEKSNILYGKLSNCLNEFVKWDYSSR